MNVVLAPAVNLLGRLRFLHKFGLIFIIFLLPLVTLSFIVLTSVNARLASLENESRGLVYIKAIRLPLNYIQQHRGMTKAFHNGAFEFRERIFEKRKHVDNSIIELERLDKELGSSLDTGNVVAEIKAKWETIKKGSFETLDEHNELVGELLELMKHISDNSEISLDPALDSYYLGAALTKELPQLIETMGQARAVSESVVARQNFTPDLFINLSVLEESMQIFSESTDKAIQSALAYNPELINKLNESIGAEYHATKRMRDMIKNDLLNADEIAIESVAMFKVATQAVDVAYVLFDVIVPELDNLFKKRIAEQTLYKYVILSGVLIALVLVIYLFIALYSSIQKNISSVGSSILNIADGQLYTRLEINTQDEMQQIATDFNDMAEKFEALVQQIVSATSQLASTAEQYAQISNDSAGNLQNQSRETEMVATAMNEMSATVQEVAKSAAEAATAAQNADSEATSGKNIVQDTTDSIVGLAGEVENAANVIQELAKESEGIGSVLDVIKGIAEQTNLLALNAAIEAARAGEQGRGFAVVADEVRTLASRTQDSTKEIEAMIEHLQQGANNAVHVMDAGRKKAQVGVEYSSNAASALESITGAVAIINQMNTQIASAAEEQSTTAEEMNRNIVSISQLTEETMSGASQSTLASEELAGLASNLNALVSQFKLIA